jgi:2-polyprenyl-6-methoxyphenol hydroxylase-like FAD-dependent oxidoreductase
MQRRSEGVAHVGECRRSAIVVGASMAGLLAARVLAEHFEQVTLIERDNLSDPAWLRKGVPQAAHVHGIWPRGLDLMDDWLPGLKLTLAVAGAGTGDVAGHLNWHQFGHLKTRQPVGIPVTTVSRPFLEQQVRQQVLQWPQLRTLDNTLVLGLLTDDARRRVTGVRLSRCVQGQREEGTLQADLVVDASGRAGQGTRWLANLGCELPQESRVRADISYATRAYAHHDAGDTIGHIVYPHAPQGQRGAVALAVEGGHWMVTLMGFMGERPPIDDAGFVAYARSLPHDGVYRIVAAGTDQPRATSTYHFPASVWRHYEKLRHLPQGYLAIGDAVASLNPAYGQGMTVAALQARALQITLQEHWQPQTLARRFFKRAARVVATPWLITTSEDFRYPQADGERPWFLRPLNRYFDQVHRAASSDVQMCRAFFGMAGLERHPAFMFTPTMCWRAWRGARSTQPTAAQAVQWR